MPCAFRRAILISDVDLLGNPNGFTRTPANTKTGRHTAQRFKARSTGGLRAGWRCGKPAWRLASQLDRKVGIFIDNAEIAKLSETGPTGVLAALVRAEDVKH